MSSIKEPFIIYQNILIPLMKTVGFVLDFDASDDNRYHTRFIWRKSTLETNPKSKFYGQTRQIESMVEVVGYTMDSSLYLQGILVGSLANKHDSVKMKIRYSARDQDFDVSEKYKKGIIDQLRSKFVSKLVDVLSIGLDDLPNELQLKILSLLPPQSIIKMSSLSTHWHQLSLDELLWRKVVQKRFPEIFERHTDGNLFDLFRWFLVVNNLLLL